MLSYQQEITKCCKVCLETKSISEFYRQSAGKYINGECKCCAKARIRRWNAANKERVLASKKRTLERNRPLHYERCTRWRRNNKAIVNKNSAKYRALRKKSIPRWANEFFMQEAYHLAQLRTQATGIRWEVDHIVPLQSKLVCGLHVENNLRVIPMAINRSKSNRVWPDMAEGA